MINKAIIVGRLTKDAIFSNNGTAVLRFRLASERPFSNQSGEKEADFVDIVAFRGQAESSAPRLGKGSMVGVTGRIQSRSYDKDGRTVYVTEVVADEIQWLDLKDPEGSGGYNQGGGYNNGGQQWQGQQNGGQWNGQQSQGWQGQQNGGGWNNNPQHPQTYQQPPQQNGGGWNGQQQGGQQRPDQYNQYNGQQPPQGQGSAPQNNNNSGQRPPQNQGGGFNPNDPPFDMGDPFANDGKPINISDDDLPF